MYIHQFCGSWLDHSFWKAGFVLNSHADLQRLRQSNVSSLWIDSDKGLDLPANPQPSAPAAQPPLKSEAPLRVERAEEIQRALKICAHSKKAVMQMFQEVRMGQAIELVQVDELVHNISSSLLRHPDVLISLARRQPIPLARPNDPTPVSLRAGAPASSPPPPPPPHPPPRPPQPRPPPSRDEQITCSCACSPLLRVVVIGAASAASFVTHR
ncbi:DUF3391 domain-containing protein [Pseudomonas protegens]|uniref:DUF3391 domain-containing protein n=1 Tax=Pseudomonas protegens TaxID=380021 RepID=UPI00215D65C6|nr:DUF3391 domain-containing protein [Pseudomonas protegens]